MPLKKGDKVILKNKQEATYIGPTSHQPNKPHLIKLASGEHLNLYPGKDYFTPEEMDASKAAKLASRQQNKAHPVGKIRQWKGEIALLKNELAQEHTEQESEVGDGGTDDFEAAGKHNEYGGRMNAIEKKIAMLQKKIDKYEKPVIGDEVRESIKLLEELTKQKVSLK